MFLYCLHAYTYISASTRRFDYSDADGHQRSNVDDCLCVKEGDRRERRKVESEQGVEEGRIEERGGKVGNAHIDIEIAIQTKK